MSGSEDVDSELEHVDIGHGDVERGLHLTEEGNQFPKLDEPVAPKQHNIVPSLSRRQPYQRKYL